MIESIGSPPASRGWDGEPARRAGYGRYTGGMKSASLTILMFGAVVACSGSSSPSDLSTSNGATDPTTAGAVASACEKLRARAAACEANPDKAKEEADEDCEQVSLCHHGRSIRNEVRDELDACAVALKCGSGVPGCRRDVARRHASDEGVAAFRTACSRRADECNEPQNTYVSSGDCEEFAIVSDRAAFTKCLSEPCKNVGSCFAAVLGACD